MLLPLAFGWFLTFGIGIVGVAIVICWVIGLVDLSKRTDLERADRMRWLLLIVLIPIIGTIVYWAKRPLQADEREQIIRSRTAGRDY
jgi:hypothetical protein